VNRNAIVLAALVAGLVLAFSLPHVGADSGDAKPDGSATLVFPSANLVDRGNASGLATDLAQKLSLPPILPGSLAAGRSPFECCLLDWGNHSIAVSNQTEVSLDTTGTPRFLLKYSETDRLVFASVMGAFGPTLPSANLSSMFVETHRVWNTLGISGFATRDVSWAGFGSVQLDGTNEIVPTTTIAIVSIRSGLPVAYGNELRLTFDTVHKMAIELVVFPWFTAPNAILTPEDAFAVALSSLNRSIGPSGAVYARGAVYFAFDFVRYSLTYQVETLFRDTSSVTAASGEYRIWVDPYSGGVTYTVLIPPRSGPGPPATASAILLLTVGTSIIVALSFIYLEPLKIAAFSALVPLYSRLNRGSVLEHFVRGQLYGFIVSHPGVPYSEIRDAFSLTNGTTTYHLAVLETLGFVKSATEGIHKRFYAADETRNRLGRLLSDLQYRILEIASQSRIVTSTDLVKTMKVSRQRADYNLRRLKEFGLLRLVLSRPGTYELSASPTEIREPADSEPKA